jgi:hypothetical protein
MTAETFRSWTEQHLLLFKFRMMGFGQGIRVIRTLSTCDAEGILASPQFLKSPLWRRRRRSNSSFILASIENSVMRKVASSSSVETTSTPKQI